MTDIWRMSSLRASAMVLVSSSLLAGSILRAQSASQPVSAVRPTPGVDVWLDTDFYESLSRGEAFFNAVPGTYVIVVRVSTRNTLDVLYPATPKGQTPYVRPPEAQTEVAFRTGAVTGLELLYAISSDRPFDFSRVSRGGHWNPDRLEHPTGTSAPEIAGYFFNDVIGGSGTRFSMGQASYINGAATFKVGDPGFPTVSSVIDAAGIACHWHAPDNNGRVCGHPPAPPPPPPPPSPPPPKQ